MQTDKTQNSQTGLSIAYNSETCRVAAHSYLIARLAARCVAGNS